MRRLLRESETNYEDNDRTMVRHLHGFRFFFDGQLDVSTRRHTTLFASAKVYTPLTSGSDVSHVDGSVALRALVYVEH